MKTIKADLTKNLEKLKINFIKWAALSSKNSKMIFMRLTALRK